MPFHVVGAVAIKVRPDSTKFREEAEAQLKKEARNLEAPVKLRPEDQGALAATKLAVAELNKKIAASNVRVKVPMKVQGGTPMADVTKIVKEINAKIKASKIRVLIPVEVDDKSAIGNVSQAVKNAQKAANGSVVNIHGQLTVDDALIKRQLDRLTRDGTMTIKPDLDKSFDDLQKLVPVLQAEVQVKKERIQDHLNELTALAPLRLSTDPQINTKAVRERWEWLKREIEADKVDVSFNLDRIKKIDNIIAPVDVDVASINDSIRRASDKVTALLHPKVEIDKLSLSKLRNLDVDLDAKINVRREQVQETLRQMERLKPFVLSTDPRINTEEVRKQWDRLKKQLQGDTVELKADLDRQAQVRAQLAELTRNRHIDLIIQINQRSLATAKATLAALSGLNVFQRAGEMVERIATNIDNYALRLGKIGTITGNLLNVMGSGTATLATFGSQLGQLGGFALAAPAALSALVAAAVAGKMAFEGFGDAISGDFEALSKLPVFARDAARSLQGVWASIQQPAQESFWEGMGNSLTTFVKTSLPQIRAGMVELSGAMGKVLNEGLQGLTEFARKGEFAKLLSNMSQGLRNAAPAAYSISDAFVTIGEAGARYFPKVGTYLREMADQFDRWIRKSAENGNLTKWMENAVTTASNLKNGIKDLVGIFGGIADAAKRAGGGGVQAFADQMERIRKIVEGPVFQDTMTTLFEGARQGAKALYDALGPMGDTLASMAPTLKNIFLSVGQTVGNLLSTISEAMQSPIFQGGLAALFNGIQTGMAGFSKYIPGIVEGLGSLGQILGNVFANVLPGVGRGFEIIADAVTEMAPTLREVGNSLGGVVNAALDTLSGILPLVTGPLTVVLDLFNGLPDPIKATVAALILFRPLAHGLIGIMGSIAARASGVAGATAALSGLKGALATGVVTIGLVAIATGFQNIGDRAEYAKDATRRAMEYAKQVAEIQLKNPFSITGGPDAEKLALERYLTFVDKLQTEGIKQVGTKGGMMDMLLGVDSPQAAKSLEELKGLSTQLGSVDLGKFGDFFAGWGGDVGNAYNSFKDLNSEVKSMIGSSGDIEKMKEILLDTEWGRAEFITAGAEQAIERFGRITSTNAPLIERSLNGTRSNLTGFQSAAEIMASSLGGTANEVEMNSVKFAHGLEMIGESPRQIAKFMTELGFSTPQIEKALQSLGVSAEQAGEDAKFGFGSVAEATGLLGSELARNTPLLYNGSDGITELTRGLSEATGVDANFLANIMRNTGMGAQEMAAGMSEAGVPAQTIKTVLGELGLPASEAMAALEGVARVARDTSREWSSFSAMEFTAALDEIAASGGTAAEKADALFWAIDRLKGGVVTTEQLVGGFESTLDGFRDIFEVTAEEVAGMKGEWTSWGEIVDETTGAINQNSQAGRDLAAGMADLASKGMSVAQDAFDKTYAKTGDVTQAMDAAEAAISGQINTWRENAGAANLNQQEVDALLRKYNLMPDQVRTNVAFSSGDAEAKMSGLIGMIAQLKPGVTAPIGLLDEDARTKLESLGVQLRQLEDGTWEATLSTDDATARGQVEGFIQWASTQTAKTEIDAATERAKEALDTFMRIVRAARAAAQVDADTRQSEDKTKNLLQWIDSLIGTVTTGNNTDPASTAARGLAGWISSIWSTMTTGNNTGPAQDNARGLLGWINGLWGYTNTGANTGNARDSVGGLLGWISGQSASVTVYAKLAQSSVNAVLGQIRSIASADGNLITGAGANLKVHKFANGGFGPTSYGGGKEKHTAHITKTLRIFGEPETGGEAYIPLSMRKRARSMKILNEVADRFGVETVPKTQSRARQYADGGISAPAVGATTQSAEPRQVIINQYSPVVEKDSTKVARASQELLARGLL